MSKLGEKLIAAAQEGVDIAKGIANGTILPAGSFKVSDYRKDIPVWVKVSCAIRAWIKLQKEPSLGGLLLFNWAQSLRYDHRPPLQDRPYDLDNGDFIPPQNDPFYIEALTPGEHDERTFGRKDGAEKTVTTVGSDAHNRKRVRNLSKSKAAHDIAMAAKAGDTSAMKQVVSDLEKDRRKSRKIPSRGFPKQRRPMRRAS